MKRLVLHVPKRKEVSGPRVHSKAFGGGTILKEGAEQSLVVWDAPAFNTHAGTYTVNKTFKRLT